MPRSRRIGSARIQVDPDIRRARTLPPEAFTEAAFLERELSTIFDRSWLFVPQRSAAALREDPRSLADLVRRRGCRAPITMLERPFFLQRGWDGILRCFPNVCTHAWHPLVRGAERQRTIVCPQHSRQFDCQGRFLSQPGFPKKMPGFPSPADSLTSLPVASWGDFFFVALAKPTVSFEKAFEPVAASLARIPLERLERRPVNGEERIVDGNWKQHAWNYMDCLHIPYIHRAPGGLADAVDMSSYRTELHPQAALQWVYAKNPAHGFDPAHLPARLRDSKNPARRVFALWWFIFPNLALNLYPWGISVNVYMPVPKNPGRTLFLWYHYAWDEARYARREIDWLNRQVDDEDVDAMRQVLQGIRSGWARPGRFSPTEETGPHWFHRLVSATVAGT